LTTEPVNAGNKHSKRTIHPSSSYRYHKFGALLLTQQTADITVTVRSF